MSSLLLASPRGFCAGVDRAIEEGAYSFSSGRLKRLAKAFKGSDFAAKVTERVQRLAGAEFAAEIKAERALKKIERKLELKKFCKRCRTSTVHKEARKTG